MKAGENVVSTLVSQVGTHDQILETYRLLLPSIFDPRIHIKDERKQVIHGCLRAAELFCFIHEALYSDMIRL